jgi:hypothetical protein
MKIKLIPWLRQASGKYGESVFRTKDGESILALSPTKRKSPYSEAELGVQERFLQARDYANYVQLKPDLLALYEQAAEEAGKPSAYALARDDWFKPPKVTALQLHDYNGQTGSIVKFITRDELGVVKAVVNICDEEEGTLIEQGLAVEEVEGSGHWLYTATIQAPSGRSVIVEVEAYDHPGNKGRSSAVRTIP